MSNSENREPDFAALLSRMDAMQEAMQRQHDAAMRQQASTLQLQHQREMQELRESMQREIGSLRTMIAPSTPATAEAPVAYKPLARVIGRPPGGRGKKLGMGLGLAFLLLIAPSQSAVTHASLADGNIILGDGAGTGNTGSNISVVGVQALSSTNTGNYNTAFGWRTLYSNTSGFDNIALGPMAMYGNTTGKWNTAVGDLSLYYNTTGTYNTASGFSSLGSNSTGSNNTANGRESLYANTTGGNNAALGAQALLGNSTGSGNTAVGNLAGFTTTQANANTTGSDNTFIGSNSGSGTPTQLTNATAIGANAHVSQDNSIVLGGTGANTQKVGVGTETPHSAFQVAKGFLQIRPITGSEPAAAQCATADDAGRLVVRTDGNVNLYVCNGTNWIGK